MNSITASFLASVLGCALSWTLADTSYFPIKVKPSDEGVTAFAAEWYGRSLERMDEPRLPNLAKDSHAEIYRMTILPTWGNSIAVRVQKHGTTYSLFARRLNGQAGYEPGTLVETKEAELTEEDSKTLDELITNSNFFASSSDDHVLGMDGDEWILEGVSHGKYHVITHWCASSYKTRSRGLASFVALCRFLVDKSTLSERPKNKGHKLI